MQLNIHHSLNFWFAQAAQPDHPLVLFLHGSGERGSNADDVLKWGLPKVVAASASAPPFHLVAPQCPAEAEWSDVLGDCLDVLEAYQAATVRVAQKAAVGFSMGGQGALELVGHEPDCFAAAIAVAPRYTALLKQSPPSAEGTAIHIVHGEDDVVVPVSNARAIATAIGADAPRLTLEVLPRRDHFIADEVFALDRFGALLANVLQPR